MANNKWGVDYEWNIQTWIDEDIDENDFRDRLREFDKDQLIESLGGGGSKKLVLVRADSDYERTWAYVENGNLPAMMSDAYDVARHRVPIAYSREFERMKRRLRDQP